MNGLNIKEAMEHIHISEEMQEKIIINVIINQMENGGNKTGNWKKTAASAAVAALTAGIVSLPVQAVVRNILEARMESIPKEEVQDISDMVQGQAVSADGFSREYSAEEKERSKVLWQAYENGRFPEKVIIQVEDTEAVTEGMLCYIRSTGVFNLPDQEMTDEELLEIIDFQHQMSYAIEQSPAAQEARNATDGESIDISQDTDSTIPIQEVERVVEKIYDVQSDIYETSVEADIAQNYTILLKSKVDDKCFRIVYNMDKGRIEELDYSQGINNYTEGVEVNVDEYINNFEYIKDMLADDLSVTEEMEKCYCDYNVSPDGSLVRGIISYLVILENGECYVVKYNCKDKVVSNILLTDYQYYQGIIDLNESKRENRGITRKRIDLTVYEGMEIVK